MEMFKNAAQAGREVRRLGQLNPNDERDPALTMLGKAAAGGMASVGPVPQQRRGISAPPQAPTGSFDDILNAYRNSDAQSGDQIDSILQAYRGTAEPEPQTQAPEDEGSLLGDVGRSVARGGIALGGGFYELFNLASQGGLDTATKRAFGVSGTEAISSSRESLNQADSPELQRQRQQLAEADGFWDSFSTVLTNPRLMGSMALEMLPQVVTVAGAAKTVASKAMNSAYQKALTAGATKEAATTAAEQAGKRAALYTVMGVNPALESGMASGEIRSEILSMSEADLQNSPQYQALIKQHGDTDEGRATARARLANDAANAAALVTAPISLAATAVFGGIEPDLASRAASRAVTSRLGLQAARPTIGEVAKGVTVGGAREMAQESVEEGGSQFGQNVGAVTSGADPDRSLLQDVPEAAGAGGALGFGVGALGSIRRPQIGSQAPAQPGAQPGAQAPAPGDQSGDQNLAAPTGLRMDADTFNAQFQSEEIVPVLSALYYQAGADNDAKLQTRIAEIARRKNVFEDLNETSQNEQLVTRGFNVLDASGAGFAETFLNTITEQVQLPDNVAVAPKAEGISIDQDQADIDQFSFSDPADNTGIEDLDPRPREEVFAGFQRKSQFIATQPPAARQALARSAIQGMLDRGFSQEEANEVFGQFFTPFTLEERQSIIDNVTQAIERQKATNPNLQVPAEIQVTAAPPVVTRIADALGIKAFGYNAGSEVSRGGFIAEGPNGRYIAINTNERVEDLQLFILGHEVFHELVRRQPNAARELIQEITSYLESGKASAKLDDFRAKLATKYDTNAINEEVAADLMGYLFTQQGFWGEVAKRNPSLVEQILEVLNTIIAKAKASVDKVLKQKSAGAARVQAAKELLKSATRVRGMMAGFLAENAANTGSAAAAEDAAMELDLEPGESPEQAIVRLAGQNKKASAARIFKDAGLYRKTNTPFEAFYLQAQKKAKDAASKPQESVTPPPVTAATTATPLRNVPESITGVVLTGTSPYLAKDQRKADRATKFIGRGSPRSSTAQYAQDFGALANSGTYYADDVVFISAEGNRDGRVQPDFTEIQEAMSAGATILTDDANNRNRAYNVGERQVAEYLANNGYSESRPGEWTPAQESVTKSRTNVPKSDTTAPVLGDATKAEYVKLFSGLAQGTAEMSYRDRIARLKQLAKDMQDLGFTAEEAGATLQGTRDEFIYKDGQNTLETRKVVFGLNIDEEAPQGQPSTVRPSPENPNVMEGTRRPPAQPTAPDVLEQERMAKETEARRKKARIEAKKIVIKPEKPRQIPRQGEIGETDTRSYAARAQEIMTTLVSPGSAAQQVAQLETLMDQISADPENRSKQRSQVEYIFKIMSDSGALSDEDSQALRKAASIKEELDVFRDAISRIRAKDLSNRAGAVRRNIRRVKGALTALRQEMEAAGVQPNVIDRILLEREQGVDNLISGDIDSVEQIEESIPEVSESTPESRELFGDPAQAAAQVVDSILNQGEIKGYRDLTALAREADQAGVGNLDILNELRLRGIPQDQIDQFARLQSFPAYRYTLDKFMRDNSNLRSMSARDVWLGSLDRMLSVMQKSGMNPDTAMAELSPDEAALYKRWKENRKKLRSRLDKAVRTNGAGEYLFNSVEDAFPDALFNEYLLSEMRDPNKLPADVRGALQDLAGADGDLVAMWYSDVAEAMSRRPDLKQEILNVMTPTEQTAFNEWKARQDRIVVENARRIAQSPAASQLFQLKSFLPEDVYNAFADRLAVSDQAHLPAVLQAAYEIAEQNRAADTVRGDVDEVEAAIMDAIYGQDEQAADAASDDTRAPLLEVDPESGEIVDQFTQERGAVDNPQDLDNYRFKRGRFSGVVSAAQIASHLNRITSQWPTAPNYTVLNNPNQLPEGLQADITKRLGTHGAKGVITPDGQVYVFSDFIENLADAEFVLFHELYGHFGLRAFLGDKLDAFLENQYKLNQKVRQEADALIAEAKQAGRGMSVLEATEEAIADLAVNAQEPTLWMKVVDALRKFFKSIGMNSVADWMKSRASNNLAFTLSMARKAARAGAIPPMSGAPSDIRFAANKLPVEIFATKDGKTTAYGFYNAMTHNWTVFYNKGGLDPQNFAIQTFDNYQDAHNQAKLMGRVVAAKDHPNRRAKTPGSFDIGPIPYPSNMANASWWKKIGRLAQIKIQSKNLPIYEVVNYVRSKGGFTTLDRDVKLYNGRIRPYFDQFTEQMLTPISEALNGIKNANFSYDFRDQDGNTYAYKESELVGLYLTALHAKERNARVKEATKTNERGSGLFDSEARTILSDLQASPIAAQLNEISTITQRISEMKVNYMHMTGLINDVQAKALKGYQFYVTLSGNKKDDVDFIDKALLGGRAVNLRGSDVRRALGRETLAVDVLENTLNSYLSTLVRGQKNVVAQSVYQLFNDHPDPNFAVINPYFTAKKLDVDKLIQDKIFYAAIADNNNPVDGKAYLKSLQARIGNGFSAAEAANEINARLEDAYRQNFISASQLQGLKVRLNNSIEHNLSISADGYVTEVADDARYNDENVFIAKVNGKPVAIEFREGVDGGDRMGTFISALHGTNPPQNDMTLEAIATFNRFIGQLITSRNLSWIPVNWIRDIGTAFFNAASDPRVGQKLARQMFKESTNAYSVAINNMMDSKFAKDNGPVFKFMKKFFRRPPSAADQAMWQEFVSSGAQVFFMDRRDMKEQLAEMERVINPRTGLLGTWDAYGKFADFLGMPAEASARFAAYKTLRNAGWTKDDAAVYAKEITVNFEQGGSSRWIRSLFMFANPSIQGTARMFRDASFKNKAFMTALAGLAGFGVLMGFVGRSLGSDDEDENGVNDLDQIPRYKRATSVVIAPGMPLGSPIPMPYGWNVFYAFGTFLSDSIFGDTPVQQTTTRVLQSAVDSFYPFGQSDSSTVFGTFLKSITPTPFAPVVDMAMNESKFGGPIVKGDNPFVHADEANAYSNFNSASPISVYMARALNRITGGSQYDSGAIDLNPGYIDYMASSLLPGLPSDIGRTVNLGINAAMGKDLKNVPIPLVDRFGSKISDGWDAGAFRRAIAFVDTKYKDAITSQGERKDRILEEHPNLGNAKGTLSRIDQMIRTMRTNLRAIEMNPDIPMRDKVEARNEVEALEKEYYKMGVQAAVKAGFRDPVLRD